MAATKILALNIGASQITLAEFKVSSGNSPVLLQYGSAPLGIDPDSDADPSAFVIDAMRTVMKEKGMRPAPLLMSVSGQAVFSRFVKLPPVAKDKLLQMVRYEAEQNVPFPIGEVVWDYQLIGNAEDGEQNAMIVAVKTENVMSLTNCAQAVALEPEIVDVAPLAIANCVRFNYPDLEGCTLVLDIGARSTNLIFIEDGHVFYRSIPIAGNTITNEIAKSFSVDFREAEKMKREIGFVALGGVYASEDEKEDKVSKVIRNVVTRLHAEVNRSINFYRSQQGGAAPQRILLTGGSSVINHMDTFFREKVKVEVEYLNPFSTVEVGGHVSQERVGEDFCGLAEVIGLAMRKSGECPVAINLMPPDLVEKKTFRKRIPFLITGAVALLGGVLVMGINASAKFSLYNEQCDVARKEKNGYDSIERDINAEKEKIGAVRSDIGVYEGLVKQRTVISQRIEAIKAAMIDGMWLVSVEPVTDEKGIVTHLEIVGRGYSDKLNEFVSKANSNATAAQLFGERLARQKVFDGQVAVIRMEKDVEKFSRMIQEFKLEIGIAPEYVLGKAGE